ncbi:MAG: PQQ-binding-like beta-propeller repeat protein [Armatimonadota bacterium]
MLGNRSFVLATLTLVSAAAMAQFDGPAPLAWRWQQPSPSAPTGAPLVDGNTIYLNLGNRVYSIDRESGNTNWKFPNVQAIEGTFRRSPVLVGGVLVSAGTDKKVYGVNPANGEMKWVHESPSNIVGQPVSLGKYVVFPLEGGSFTALDASTGLSIYDTPYRSLDGIAGPLTGNGRDSVMFFDNRNKLHSINVSSRRSNWSVPFAIRPTDGTVEASNGFVYTYSANFLVCLNETSGSPKWQVPVKEPMIFSPEVGSGSIVAISRSGNAYVYSDGGALKSKAPIALGSIPLTKPTIMGKKIAFALTNGSFTIIDAESGAVSWQYYVRPMNEAAKAALNSGAAGGPPGGSGSPGGLGGGQSGPGLGGGQTGGASQSAAPVVTVPIATQIVLAGSTLLVSAGDSSVLAFDKTLGVDLTSPVVKTIWPNSGEIIAGTTGQELLFQIDDDTSGVDGKSISVTIGGKPYAFDFGKEGVLAIRVSQAKKNPTIPSGRQDIVVTVSDWLGNKTVHTVSLKVDNSLPLVPRVKPANPNGPGGPGGLGGPGGAGGFGGGGAGLGGG